MSERIERLCNIYGFSGGNYAGNVYGIDGIAPTITCVGGGGNRVPLNKIGKKSTRSLASVDELPLNFFRIFFCSF